MSQRTNPSATWPPPSAWIRWSVLSIFLISSALNYLDRLLLAALAPVLKVEFHLDTQGYGNLVAAFAISYAVASPLLGWLMDRMGLTPVTTLAVAIWSAAGMATGFVRTSAQLFWCRVVLGIGEAGGIPATGKAYGTYLLPEERALGAGVGQLGISIGALAAPLLAAWALGQGHWQWAFVAAGGCGLVWIGLWWLVNRQCPAPPEWTNGKVIRDNSRLLSDIRFWRLVVANFFAMSGYTLWTYWTTLYLTGQFHLEIVTANRQYAWIPPLGGTFGALAGGWLSLRLIRKGSDEVRARLQVCLWMAVLSLVAAAVPFTRTPMLATAAISLSYCFIAAGSTNLYTIPVDLYGAPRAASAISGLVVSYGATTGVFNPLFGFLIGRTGSYVPVCVMAAVTPLLAYWIIAPIRSGQSSLETAGMISRSS